MSNKYRITVNIGEDRRYLLELLSSAEDRTMGSVICTLIDEALRARGVTYYALVNNFTELLQLTSSILIGNEIEGIEDLVKGAKPTKIQVIKIAQALNLTDNEIEELYQKDNRCCGNDRNT